jgi:2-keto-4-pentenoate hydratase/2-oxohepta-3-ene-1,7-dioic acid hydratase in catechol pathway
MKYARYLANGGTHYGIVEGDSVRDIGGPPWEQPQPTGTTRKLSEVKLLTPTAPKNILNTGMNTRTHQDSDQNKNLLDRSPAIRERKEPSVSLRCLSALANPEDPIIRPSDAESFREEAELVVVIGKTCSKVPPDQIMDYVLGYTCGNDVCVKEWEERGEMWRAKSCDSMQPIGPWIETDLDPHNVTIRARVNGVETQSESTSKYLFTVQEVVGRMVQHITLYPGDVVFMGTVGEPSDLKPGDTVEIDIEGIGVLRNPVMAED